MPYNVFLSVIPVKGNLRGRSQACNYTRYAPLYPEVSGWFTLALVADDDPTQAFAAALREALNEAGRKQSWLGAEVARIEGLPAPLAQPQISGYLNGRSVPEPRRVFAIEEALGTRPGRLSRLLGYVPADAAPARTVADAIDEDPGLTEAQREDLLDVWQSMRARTRARRELRSTPGGP